MSQRYERMFKRLEAEGKGAFIPFVVIGDPDMETSLKIIETLAASGADALELGIPFSDPVADGPVIQAAVVRALDAGATPDKCFEVIAKVRAGFEDLPIGVLTYANAVMVKGLDSYFEAASRCGIDSVLAADLPVDEAGDYLAAAARAQVAPVFIAPPNIDDQTMGKVSAASKGYTYVVTRKGVTGADQEVVTGFSKTVDRLEGHGAPPPVVGFGISTPEHVRSVLEAGAKGAISGSATVKIVNDNSGSEAVMLEKLARFVEAMKGAT